MITTIQQAFHILDTQRQGIPFDAIKFLKKKPKQPKIEQKILFALTHVYDDTYYDDETDFYYLTPLWYAIVAETHLSKNLINLVISLFTTTEEDWDFLDEQGQYLIGKLAESYPDAVMEQVIRVIDLRIDEKSEFPYLYLFDVFYFIDKEKYKDWLLKTLENEHLLWIASFATTIADLEIKEAIPVLKRILERGVDDFSKADVEEALKELEMGVHFYPEQSKPYCQERGDWEQYYLPLENRLL